MTDAEFASYAYFVHKMMKDAAPVDTGNLQNSVVMELSKDEARIYVNDQAPYMPYTNEPWVSAYWRGKKNPNLYWWDNAVTGVMKFLERRLGGDIERVSAPTAMNLVAMAAKWQNHTGDLMPEDILLNSAYIENAQDPYADFFSRAQLIGR